MLKTRLGKEEAMNIAICDKCKSVHPIDPFEHTPIKTCDCEADLWECDEEIYPLLRTLWDKGYNTKFSCSGHAFSGKYEEDELAGVSDYPNCDVYIILDASSIKIDDITKYKYGSAFIERNSIEKIYVDAMIMRGIQLPENYVFDVDEPIFVSYIYDLYDSKEEADEELDWLRTAPPFDYRISVLYEGNNKCRNYIQRFMKLLEMRSDMAKLVDLLPLNK
jgi:hypothetical protein